MVSSHTQCLDTGMKQEVKRAEKAFELAHTGNNVVVISSGDSGIYGMAPLIMEMKTKLNSTVEIDIVPGISAFQAAASKLGAPISHDFCTISLSDLMTPWALIEKRIEAAAIGDFVTSIYNPKSIGRYWQLYRLKEIFLKHRHENTPVGIARQVGREDEKISISTLKELNPEDIDMFTILIIGNSQSFVKDNKFITPRGYYRESGEGKNLGQSIMINSFKTILSEMKNPEIDLDKKWALLHLIHTSADFDMENIFYADKGAIELWNTKF